MHTPFAAHAQTRNGLTFDGDYFEVILKTESLPFDKVQLRHEPDNEEYLIDMQECGREGKLVLWKARFRKNRDIDVTHYLFKLALGQQQYWLDARGIQKRMPGREYHFKFNVAQQPPEWVSEQVFYQIFPERFCNGNPDISPETKMVTLGERSYQQVAKPWGAETGSYDKSASCEFYGGDLAGVEQKLDYLQELGVTALYLNPVFSSHSNHKYDTDDYFTIDPHFGTNEEFAELSKNVHDREMRLILDAVVNHTSVNHKWFDISDIYGDGAYHHTNSPCRDFYFFEENSNNYIGWKEIGTLPVLNFSNPKLREQIYSGEDSVLRHWLKPPYNIDGWRFDVIHMLGEGEGAKNNAHYVREFRKTCKEENPDSYVLGEHFFEATQWLQGDQEDGAMNYYGFAHPVWSLLANKDISHAPVTLSVSEFVNWLQESKAKVPWLNQLSQLNQLDSHDTNRFLTLLNGNTDKMKFAAYLLFTYVGVPCIYYGTEVGMEGGADPDNRRCFPWERVENSDLLPFFKSLVRMRTSSPELQRGSFTLLDFSDDYLAFSRELDNVRTVIALSLTPQTVDIPVWKSGLVNEGGSSLITAEKMTCTDGVISLKLGMSEPQVIRFKL
ncbi:maltodextrin glucosidase [Vibrio sp. JC009]|nr:maltodextrin glucosidase [Vibrio sp. JC009]